MATKVDTTLHAVTPVAGYRQATATDVKDWAEKNGYTVSRGRGRMPLEVVNAFNAAHRRTKSRKGTQYVLGSATQEARSYTYTTAKGRQGKFTAEPRAIRAWAEENGHEVGARGRFRQDVLDAYGQAQRKR